MRNKVTPEEARQALQTHAAALWRFSSGKDPEFLCMASHIGGGMFATVYDLGALNPWGQSHYTDLRLQLLDGSGRTVWADWAVLSPMSPILLIQSRGADDLPDPEAASMADIAVDEYHDVYRIGFDDGLFPKTKGEVARIAAANDFRISSGQTIYDPAMTWFRTGDDDLRDKETICAHCNFNSPTRNDIGAPVVDGQGRLAGVLIGANLGPEASHQGAYMPVEVIRPFAEMLRVVKDRRYGIGAFDKYAPVVHHEYEPGLTHDP